MSCTQALERVGELKLLRVVPTLLSPNIKAMTKQWMPLTDSQWDAISPFFNTKRNRAGVPAYLGFTKGLRCHFLPLADWLPMAQSPPPIPALASGLLVRQPGTILTSGKRRAFTRR